MPKQCDHLRPGNAALNKDGTVSVFVHYSYCVSRTHNWLAVQPGTIIIHVLVYTYILLHVHVHVLVYTYILLHVHVHVLVYTYILLHVHVHVLVYTYILLHVHVHVLVYTYIYYTLDTRLLI